jgi:hypothetical protein
LPSASQQLNRLAAGCKQTRKERRQTARVAGFPHQAHHTQQDPEPDRADHRLESASRTNDRQHNQRQQEHILPLHSCIPNLAGHDCLPHQQLRIMPALDKQRWNPRNAGQIITNSQTYKPQDTKDQDHKALHRPPSRAAESITIGSTSGGFIKAMLHS